MNIVGIFLITRLEIRDAKKRAKNGYGGKAEEEQSAGPPDETGAPEQKRRYLVQSATKARERFHRHESGGHMQSAPSGFGGRPNMDDDDEDEDYSSSSKDRVSTRALGGENMNFYTVTYFGSAGVLSGSGYGFLSSMLRYCGPENDYRYGPVRYLTTYLGQDSVWK